MTEYPLAVVFWEDASNIGGWTEIEEATAFTPESFAFDFRCSNVGYLIRDDDECVIVAARADGQFQQVGLVERIPRGMVKDVWILDVEGMKE